MTTEGKIVPITNRADRTIQIDGDLADWGDLRDQSIILHQRVNQVAGPPTGDAADVAIVKLVHDQAAVYVAVRVVDEHVHNPFDMDECYRADCVELFFDVRPIAGDGAVMGAPRYSAGVHQFLIAPPEGEGKPWRWRIGEMSSPLMGEIESAGRLTEGGYTLEMRLPLASLGILPGADRLAQPIGFQVMIDDLDIAREPPPPYSYAWSGTGGYYNDASLFALADPQYHLPPVPPNGFLAAPVIVGDDNGFWFEALSYVDDDTKNAADRFQLNVRYVATVYDRAQGKGSHDVKFEDEQVTARACPPLHLNELRRRGFVERLEPGRYELRATWDGRETPGSVRRYYAVQTNGQVRLAHITGMLGDDELHRRIADGWNQIDLDTHYPRGLEEVAGSAEVRCDPMVWHTLSELAAQHGRDVMQEYRIRLRAVAVDHGKTNWQATMPLRPGPMPFTIPLKPLPMELHELRMDLIQPIGADRELLRVPLRLMPPHEEVLPSVVVDGSPILTRAVRIGDPARNQFPKDDQRDCQARSIHDLQLYDGRVYVGYGDWNENRGPIDIWSFAPTPDGTVAFAREFTVDDESVDVIRAYGTKLYVPGIDARESWEWGNLYVKSQGQWTKYRTVPNGIHVLDIAEFDGRLYVSTGTETGAALYESSDEGRTWRLCDAPDRAEGRFYRLAALDDFLLVGSSYIKQGAYRFAGGKLDRLYLPLAPGAQLPPYTRMDRLERFGNGVVYTVDNWDAGKNPLYFLNDFENGAVLVELYADRQVRDVVVRRETCYVLTADATPSDTGAFTGEIHSSRDLKLWHRIAAFQTPALPNSVELLGGDIYVGLANHARWSSADPASGSIWRLEE